MASTADSLVTCSSSFSFAFLLVTVICKHLFFGFYFCTCAGIWELWALSLWTNHVPVAFLCLEDGFIFIMARTRCHVFPALVLIQRRLEVGLVAIAWLDSEWTSKLPQLAPDDPQMHSGLLTVLRVTCTWCHANHPKVNDALIFPFLSCHALEPGSVLPGRWLLMFASPGFDQYMPYSPLSMGTFRYMGANSAEQTWKSRCKIDMFVQKEFVLNVVKIH